MSVSHRCPSVSRKRCTDTVSRFPSPYRGETVTVGAGNGNGLEYSRGGKRKHSEASTPLRFCPRCLSGLHDRNHANPMGCLAPVGRTDQDSFICACLITPEEVRAKAREREAAGVVQT